MSLLLADVKLNTAGRKDIYIVENVSEEQRSTMKRKNENLTDPACFAKNRTTSNNKAKDSEVLDANGYIIEEIVERGEIDGKVHHHYSATDMARKITPTSSSSTSTGTFPRDSWHENINTGTRVRPKVANWHEKKGE